MVFTVASQESLRLMGKIHEAMRRLLENKLPMEVLQRIIDNQFFRRKAILALLRLYSGEMKVYPEYLVSVDYSLSLKKAIIAGGYDRISPEITPERFPVEGSGKVNINFVIYDLEKHGSIESVLKEIDAAGLRPATTSEFLAFGIERYTEQGNCVISAPGFIGLDSENRRVMLHWYKNDSGGGLAVHYVAFGFTAGELFLTVRK